MTQQTQEPGALTPSAMLDVLDELAGLVENGRPVFLSGDVRVERDAVLGLVDELRRGMPSAVGRAEEVLAQARKELASARHDGEEIVATARRRAMELVEREQVVAQATAHAAEVVAAAQAEADRLRADADAYCDGRLAAFEKDLEALTAQVRAGRAKLAERLAPSVRGVRWDQVREPEWPQEVEE